MIGASAVLAWVMITGLVLMVWPVVAVGVPDGVTRNAGWLAVSGVANVVGLFSVYAALRRGKVGVVSAIASTEGAVAAVIAAAGGEAIGLGTGLLLAVITGGVFLASLAPVDGGGRMLDAAALSAVAALCFGLGLYSTGRVSDEVPLVWVAFPARLAGVAAVAIPLALAGRLVLTKKAAPLVVASGVLEVAGILAYGLGARHGIAVTAVLASQFAAIAAIGAFLLFRERLVRIQVTGVVAVALGVAALAALRA